MVRLIPNHFVKFRKIQKIKDELTSHDHLGVLLKI